MPTLSVAISQLHKELIEQGHPTNTTVLVMREDLERLLDEHTSVLRPVPLGHRVQNNGGGQATWWTHFKTSVSSAGTTHLWFVQDQTGYTYHACESKTLIRKFPALKDFL